MIKVLFFAKLREDVGISELSVPFSNDVSSRSRLLSYLSKKFGDAFELAMSNDNIVFALNHEANKEDFSIKDGDEIAFYPPVTGG